MACEEGTLLDEIICDTVEDSAGRLLALALRVSLSQSVPDVRTVNFGFGRERRGPGPGVKSEAATATVGVTVTELGFPRRLLSCVVASECSSTSISISRAASTAEDEAVAINDEGRCDR